MAVVRPDDRGFFEACLARPDDALPRLIWADYLDDTFRSKAAEYMRGERASALLTAAAERLQAGSDADRITRIVLWMARGGHLADAIDHAAASEDAVQTMRLALRLVDGGQRRFNETVAMLKVGMHVAVGGAARTIKNVVGAVSRTRGHK